MTPTISQPAQAYWLGLHHIGELARRQGAETVGIDYRFNLSRSSKIAATQRADSTRGIQHFARQGLKLDLIERNPTCQVVGAGFLLQCAGIQGESSCPLR
jgi:hypothetical protein